jgi:UDP-2,3-diacylglucosamine pyrophosphatase LpxH
MDAGNASRPDWKQGATKSDGASCDEIVTLVCLVNGFPHHTQHIVSQENHSHYRSVWISDVHLGTRGCQATALLGFLRSFECDTLYVVGDLIDIWAMKRGVYWTQEHSDVIQKILRKGRKGSKVIYIPGNHDERITDFTGDYANVHIQPRAFHTTVDGRRLLVAHGHELDTVVQNLGWLAHVGDIGYAFLLQLNGPVNFFRRLLGQGHWSLSAYVKSSVKNVVNFIGGFEESMIHFASDAQAEGIICGHIHTAAIRKIKDLDYYNTGDWVESLTALVEERDGELKLLQFSTSGDLLRTLAVCGKFEKEAEAPSSGPFREDLSEALVV